MGEELRVQRYEEKYLLSLQQAVSMRALLDSLLERDTHSLQGAYYIRSLYFDTPDDRDYLEKALGVSERTKLRLRIYDLQAQTAKLEIKAKRDKTSNKRSAVLPRAAAMQLARGNAECLLQQSDAAREAYTLYKRESRRPAALIDYERTAWVFPIGRTRITLDEHIRAAKSDAIFQPDVPMVGVLNGRVVLEIKYDQPLPPWLGRALSSVPSTKMSVSKYALAREMLY